VVLMSGAAPNDEVAKAVHAGVRGFIPKTVSSEVMQAAIGIVIAGGTYVPAEVFQQQPGNGSGTATPEPAADIDKLALYKLTPREHQVLMQLASGASNKEIGRGLGLSEVTVKLHVRQILRKISARNRAEAAVIVTRAGLI
jgi:two-component system nitrate/nitrite response regulator NarL